MNRENMHISIFFTKWTNLHGHTNMQEKGSPKSHKSPSMLPSVTAASCPRYLHSPSTASFSWLQWAPFLSLILMYLQYGLLIFTMQRFVFLPSYHLPMVKKLHRVPCVTAENLSTLFKPIYTVILNTVIKERLLNRKKVGSIRLQTFVLDTASY